VVYGTFFTNRSVSAFSLVRDVDVLLVHRLDIVSMRCGSANCCQSVSVA
jgi:hypothetical protein